MVRARRVRLVGPTLVLAVICLAAPTLVLAGDSRSLLGNDQADTQRRASQRIPLGTPIAAAIWRLQDGGYKCYPPRDGQVVCAHQSFFGFTFWSVTLTVRADHVAAVRATCSHTFL